MTSTALERVVHYECPEWGDSIRAARSEAGFFFGLSDEQLWEWLVSGGHLRVEEIAHSEVKKLGIEGFYIYYLCCFYSKYDLPGGSIDFEAIKGPPWVSFACPAAKYGPEWQNSVRTARAHLCRNLNSEYDLPTQATCVIPEAMPWGQALGPFLSWLYSEERLNEVATLALEKVNELGIEEVNSVLWLCCLIAPGAKALVSGSALLFQRFPQIMEWDQFGAKCEERPACSGVRAYPSHIDWSEGTPPPEGLVVLPPKPGIRYEMESGERMTLGIRWDPLVATSEADLVDAVKALRRHYRSRYWKRDVDRAHGILPALSAAKSKGGRPRWGAAQDAIARECARLKDREGLTYREIAQKFGFPLQRDSYGNLTQSSTARKYVKRGRKLIWAEGNRIPT